MKLWIGGFAAVMFAGFGVAVVLAQRQTARVDTNNVRLRVVESECNTFDSGWHTHPGPVIVQVREGTFKIYQTADPHGDSAPHVVHEGETYIETPFVPVRAISKGPIKWTTSMILPVGVDPADPATPAQACQ